MFAYGFLLVLLLLYFCTAVESVDCPSSEDGKIRLFNSLQPDNTKEGSVQICYFETWETVCSYDWNCEKGNIVCKELGYYKAREVVHNANYYFGQWNSYLSNYYYCYSSSNTMSLKICSGYDEKYFYQNCHENHGEAGVRCVEVSSSSCSNPGSLRLTGGESDNEGVLEYCYDGKWSIFCNLDDEEAAVACKQLGYTEYGGFLSPREYSWDDTKFVASPFNIVTCSSGTETSLSQCSMSTTSESSCAASCHNPKAIKCHTGDECTDGEIRLMNGSISQEGRVEICVYGVWHSVCGSGWTKQAAFFVCKKLGYINEPAIYTNSEYGDGTAPLVYNNIQCQGWEKTITDCTMTWQFDCYSTAGVLCPDDCTNGDVRLVGGSSTNQGTVQVCAKNVWGLISDVGFDEKDTKVICRQLNLPFDGSRPVYDFKYRKPNKTIHYSYMLCNGNETKITSCKKVTHSLAEGSEIYQESAVAGVTCAHPMPPTNIPVRVGQESSSGEFVSPTSEPTADSTQSHSSSSSVITVLLVLMCCVIALFSVFLLVYSFLKYQKKTDVKCSSAAKAFTRRVLTRNNIYNLVDYKSQSEDEHQFTTNEKSKSSLDPPPLGEQDNIDISFISSDEEHAYAEPEYTKNSTSYRTSFL